jgi:hypothetical protein
VKDAHVMKELKGIINSLTNRRVNEYTNKRISLGHYLGNGCSHDMTFALYTIIHKEFRTSSLLHLSDFVLIDNNVIYK